MKSSEHSREKDFRSLKEIAAGFVLQPLTKEEETAVDAAFGFHIPDKGGEVPTGEEKVEKKVKKQVKGTRSKIMNTVGIIVLSTAALLGSARASAQSTPPTNNKPVATSSAEAGEKQEKIDPWHIVTLADGSQTKIVQMKDGRYILGVILPDGKKLKLEAETSDPQKVERLAIAWIIQYNETYQAEKEANQAEQRAEATMQKLRNLGNDLAEKAVAVVYKDKP